MSLPFFHKNHTDISNYLDFPGDLLTSPASSQDCILIAGPDLVRREAVPGQGHTPTYLERLLKGMVVWCTQNKVIQDQDIIHDLHILLHNGALVPLAYRIEEYLAAAQLKEQCLRAVLNPYSQVEEIHHRLTRFPFRGYITTSYDTCIETAYAETQQGQLGKFYQPSLAHAVDASRKKQPFILKLYGDLAEPDSIKLGHRLLTGLYAEDIREQLRQLFSETRTIFIGFTDADEDLIAMKNLVTDGYDGQQKHPTHARELHDGIITKPGDQSSPDYIAHEFSPRDRPPGPVISSQSQDITSKDERPEKETTPDTTRQEAISVLASAEEQHKDNSTSTGSPQSSNIPPASFDGNSTQPPSNGSPAVKALASSLPDESGELFFNFTSLLKDMGYKVEKKDIVGPRGTHSITHVENTNKEFRSLIYIPEAILTDNDPNSANSNAVINLWYDFRELPSLFIFTESHYCGREIDDAIKHWPIPGKIVFWHQIKDLKIDEKLEEHKYWITKILDMDV